MSQVTGKKVAVTPMPTPTGTSGAIIDSFNTQDDQTVNAPSIHIVKDALTTINDNLSGFKFYPIGTQLVALVSNNSYYTDANRNYIIADSTTGQSMIDNVKYKALASVEDLRGKVGADTATPFNKKKILIPRLFCEHTGNTSGDHYANGQLTLSSDGYSLLKVGQLSYSGGNNVFTVYNQNNTKIYTRSSGASNLSIDISNTTSIRILVSSHGYGSSGGHPTVTVTNMELS